MGATLSHDSQLQKLCDETGFTYGQVKRLQKRFADLDKEKRGFLTRDQLLNVDGLKHNPLGPRIVEAFIRSAVNEDEESDFLTPAEERVDSEQFVRVFARFQPGDHQKANGINSREEKLKFVFSMCDLDKDGIIKHNEFKSLLQKVVGNSVSPERLNDIIDRAMEEADFEKNNIITFPEFCRAMEAADVEQRLSLRFAR